MPIATPCIPTSAVFLVRTARRAMTTAIGVPAHCRPESNAALGGQTNPIHSKSAAQVSTIVCGESAIIAHRPPLSTVAPHRSHPIRQPPFPAERTHRPPGRRVLEAIESHPATTKSHAAPAGSHPVTARRTPPGLVQATPALSFRAAPSKGSTRSRVLRHRFAPHRQRVAR